MHIDWERTPSFISLQCSCTSGMMRPNMVFELCCHVQEGTSCFGMLCTSIIHFFARRMLCLGLTHLLTCSSITFPLAPSRSLRLAQWLKRSSQDATPA